MASQKKSLKPWKDSSLQEKISLVAAVVIIALVLSVISAGAFKLIQLIIGF